MYYLSLAERATLEGAGQAYWLPRLAADAENFQASLAWCRDNGEREMGLRLSIALMPFWRLRDQQRAARSWLATFMNAEGEVAPTIVAMGMLWEGLLLMRGEGDTTSSLQRFNAAIALFDREGDLDGASEARQAIGDAFGQRGDWLQARPYFQESLDLAMQAGNAYLTAHGYMGLALVAQEEGAFEVAQENWERTLAWAEQSGNQASVSLALNSLGEMARGRAEWSSAAHYYEQALNLARTLGSEFRIALALHNLGYVSLHDGHPEVARRQFIDSLWLYDDMQHRKGMAECLAGLARVDAFTGYPHRAALLAGASEAVLQRLGTRLDAMDRADYAQTLDILRETLGYRLDASLAVGRAMPLKEATELAVASRFDPVVSPKAPIP
ncbi:MAG: tetratricopeptide repeat protein [Thermomicrobiales bacterium]